jgi:type I restriction enzyme S subunit
MRFDEIADSINDRVEDPSKSGVQRYVGLEHLDPDSLVLRRWGSPEEVESTKLRFQRGDIIFGKRRAYQRKLAVADFEGICSAHAMVLRAKPGAVVPAFLPFFIQSDTFMERAEAISVGSLSPTINWKMLAAEVFALPPLEQQLRYVDVLGPSSRLRDLTEDCLQHGHRILAAWLESSWRSASRSAGMGTFRDVATHIDAGSSPSSESRPPGLGEYGVLKVSAVGDWGFVATESKTIDAAKFIPALAVQPGDILATRANANPSGIARMCIVEATPARLMLSDKTWRLRLDPAVAAFAPLIVSLAKCSAFRKYIHGALNGTEAKNLSQESLLAAPFPAIRRYDGLQRLNAELTTLLAMIRSIRLRQDQTARVFRSLQHIAFDEVS